MVGVKNNNEFELLKVFQIVKSNQELEKIENGNKDKKENITINNIDGNVPEDILLSPKKRKLPLFSAFTKIELFELISHFVVEGQFNNWEIISILTYVTNLGTTLHLKK